MIIAKLTIEHKSQNTSKLTITSNKEVRIKIQDGLAEDQINYIISKFTTIAESCINKGLHYNRTLRGSLCLPQTDELYPSILYLKSNAKGKQKKNIDKYRIYLDTFEIVYTSQNKKFACVLIKHEDKFLTVTRKNNHNSFGMPGGTYESNLDGCFVDTAIRETLEETGTDVVVDVNVMPYIEDDCITWYGHFKDTAPTEFNNKNENETGVVSYQPREILTNVKTSSFARYNKQMFNHFINLGVILNEF